MIHLKRLRAAPARAGSDPRIELLAGGLKSENIASLLQSQQASLALQRGVGLPTIRHALTLDHRGASASLLGAIVDEIGGRGQ